MTIQELLQCKALAHCKTCRLDHEVGEGFRKNIMTHLGLDEFVCPYGIPLGINAKNKESIIESMESRGLGDTLARVIKAITFGKVSPCGGCAKRQEALNRLVPYKKGEPHATEERGGGGDSKGDGGEIDPSGV